MSADMSAALDPTTFDATPEDPDVDAPVTEPGRPPTPRPVFEIADEPDNLAQGWFRISTRTPMTERQRKIAMHFLTARLLAAIPEAIESSVELCRFAATQELVVLARIYRAADLAQGRSIIEREVQR